MQISRLITILLRYFQINLFIPYSWKPFRNIYLSGTKWIEVTSEISSIYSYELNENLPGNFKYNRKFAFFSTIWVSFICFFGVYVLYGNLFIENLDALTYKYTVPIFDGSMITSFIFSLIFIRTKSKMCLEIFKNLNTIDFQNQNLESIYKSLWFYRIIITFIFYIIYFAIQSAVFFKDIRSGWDIFYPSEIIFFTYETIVKISIVLFLDIICFLYSFAYDIQNLQTKLVNTKTIWNKKTNKPIIYLYTKVFNDTNDLENSLKAFTVKFYLINQHQKTLNSFFGPLVTCVLIQNVSLIIFRLYIFSVEISDILLGFTFHLITVINSIISVFIIFTSTSVLNQKVSIYFMFLVQFIVFFSVILPVCILLVFYMILP